MLLKTSPQRKDSLHILSEVFFAKLAAASMPTSKPPPWNERLSKTVEEKASEAAKAAAQFTQIIERLGIEPAAASYAFSSTVLESFSFHGGGFAAGMEAAASIAKLRREYVTNLSFWG